MGWRSIVAVMLLFDEAGLVESLFEEPIEVVPYRSVGKSLDDVAWRI
jgi:hypothetical protein